MPICPTCSATVPDGFVYCGACGDRLPPPGASAPPPFGSPPDPLQPGGELAQPDRSWARSHRGLVTAVTAMGLIGVGTATLFTVGYPMGWPLSPGFNMVFVVMGGAFAAVGVSTFLKPRSVSVGTTDSFGRFVRGRTATEREGQSFGVLFILLGIGIVVVANLLGLMGETMVPPPTP